MTDQKKMAWRCNRCSRRLGERTKDALYLKYKRAQFIVKGEVTAICPVCSAINETCSEAA